MSQMSNLLEDLSSAWSSIRELEERVRQRDLKIKRLEEEVALLRETYESPYKGSCP